LEQLDSRLRDAFYEALPDASLVQTAVRNRIATERARLWTTLVCATVVLLALAGYSFLKPGAGVYAELARDHQREVVEQQPRHWRVEPGEVAALIARYNVTEAMVSSLAPNGYRLEHAKTCAMGRKPVLHLVYTDGYKHFSVYLRPRSGQEVQPVAMTIDSEQVAMFSRNGFEAAIVTVGSGSECLEWARRAAGIL
jgi:hypothetical protein